jgi:hypothetical protein
VKKAVPAGERSLFIVALPRTLSSEIHGLCRSALGLRAPAWTTHGEILNGDRLVLAPQARASGEAGAAPKFTLPSERYRYEQLLALLDDVVAPEGRVYKDVVQPFVVSAWLADRDLAVLRIRRPLADVALSMERRAWLYPERAAPTECAPEDRLLAGLRAAERAHAELTAGRVRASLAVATVEFDDLVASPEALRTALGRLYPGREIALSDPGEEFRAYSRQVLATRSSERWRELDRRAAGLA